MGLKYKEALEEGCVIYDAGRGEEKYKFDLGADVRFNENIIVTNTSMTKSLKRMARKIKGFIR